MAAPIPEEVCQSVLVVSGKHQWQCVVMLEDEGPAAGSYVGFAINEELGTLVTPVPGARILDTLYSIVRMVINRDCPIRTPADDVRTSRDYATGKGFKNPL
jgi:hypothetical protein